MSEFIEKWDTIFWYILLSNISFKKSNNKSSYIWFIISYSNFYEF